MQNVTIRPAAETDIPEMARLWHEKAILYQQFDQRFTMLPDGDLKWSAELSNWLQDVRCAVFVAQFDDHLIGYAIGWMQPGPPGMSPDKVGVITELTLDMHRYEGAVGRLLLQPLRDWLNARGISYVVAYVPHRQAVEQAFWHALGATDWLHMMWMKS